MPALSVVLPTYNGERHLRETVQAILSQTFTDFELLILDDGSSDGTLESLSAIADARVRIHRNAVNLGLPTNMNIGLALATGKYVARVDQDDLPTPDRFAKQVAHLEAHAETTVVGSQIEHFGEVGGRTAMPLDDGHIKANFVCGENYFANQASMGRLDFYRSHRLLYDANLYVVDDLGFWFDCMLCGATFANLPESLTRYRVHRSMTSFNLDGRRLDQSKSRLFRRLLPAYFPTLTGAECEALIALHQMRMRDGLDLDALINIHQIVGRLAGSGPVLTDSGQDPGASQQALLLLLNRAREHAIKAGTLRVEQCQVLDRVFHLAGTP